jgi:hypothetical protein
MYVPVFAPLKEGFRFTGMNDRALGPLRHRPAGMKPVDGGRGDGHGPARSDATCGIRLLALACVGRRSRLHRLRLSVGRTET